MLCVWSDDYGMTKWSKYKTKKVTEKNVFIRPVMCKTRPKPILISYLNTSLQTHIAALQWQVGWVAKKCLESEGICKWLGMPWSLFRGSLPERGRRRVQRERWRTRDTEQRFAQMRENSRGEKQKKKRQRSGPRLACLWRPAESECCLITIRVISFGLISPQHASTATPGENMWKHASQKWHLFCH